MAKDILCFPALPDAMTGRTAIGLTGIHRGRLLTLGERVCTGSWLRKDNTRGENFSRWVSYTRTVCGVPMTGWTLLPEREYARVLTFAEFAQRRAA